MIKQLNNASIYPRIYILDLSHHQLHFITCTVYNKFIRYGNPGIPGIPGILGILGILEFLEFLGFLGWVFLGLLGFFGLEFLVFLELGFLGFLGFTSVCVFFSKMDLKDIDIKDKSFSKYIFVECHK